MHGVICSSSEMVKTECLDNDACCLTEEKDQELLISLSEVSLFICLIS